MSAGLPIPKPLELRVVKVSLPKKAGSGIFITTLKDKKQYSRRAIKELYHHRWQEEEFFKLIKELLEAENIRGKCPLLVGQEIVAIHLYCLLTRILMMECSIKHEIPHDEIAQRHAFLAVSRHLDRVFTAETPEECLGLLETCIDEISWRRYKKRLDRSFPRRSKSSYGKWGRKDLLVA